MHTWPFQPFIHLMDLSSFMTLFPLYLTLSTRVPYCLVPFDYSIHAEEQRMDPKYECGQDEYFLLNLFQFQDFQCESFHPKELCISYCILFISSYFSMLLFIWLYCSKCSALSCHIFYLDVLLLIMLILTVLPIIMMGLLTDYDNDYDQDDVLCVVYFSVCNWLMA